MSPSELLRSADTLLTGAGPSLGICWQRVCAGLLRIALEQTLRQYWHQRRRRVGDRASIRSQLLVLAVVADKKIAATASGAWHGLSRAMHHHAYELPPTVAELRGWYHDVVSLLPQLQPEVASTVPRHPDQQACDPTPSDSEAQPPSSTPMP